MHFLSRDCLDRGDDVLQFGDLMKSASSRQPIVFGHRQDERALVRLQAFEEGVELVGHGHALAVRDRDRQPKPWRLSIACPAVAPCSLICKKNTYVG